jgi:hypothetical protein
MVIPYIDEEMGLVKTKGSLRVYTLSKIKNPDSVGNQCRFSYTQLSLSPFL